MPTADYEIDATLLVEDGATQRPLAVGVGGDLDPVGYGAATQATSAAILARLLETLTVGGTVALTPAVLEALEPYSTVGLTQATLDALETVGLSTATIDALRPLTTVDLGSATLAALETVDLGSATLAALETTNEAASASLLAAVDGLVTVEAAQDVKLGQIRDATQAQLVPNQIVTRTTPLAANGTYTTPWYDVSQLGGLSVQVSTDKPGDAYIEHSLDAVDPIADRTGRLQVSGTLDSNGRLERFVAVPFHNQYVRVRYVNGATAQTVFRLQVRLLRNAPPVLQRLEVALTDAGTAQTVRSVSAGKDPSGSYINERAPGVAPSQSSTSVLGVGAEFTAAWIDVSAYVAVGVLVDADVNSADNGVRLEWSHDAVTVARTTPMTYTSAPDGRFFSSQVQGQYLRVRYINGQTAQATFVLQTLLFDESLPVPAGGIESPLDAGLLVAYTRSVLAAKNAAGLYGNVLRGLLGGLEVEEKAADQLTTRQVAVGNSAVRIDSAPLTGRKAVEVRAMSSNGNGVVYVGRQGVTTLSGRDLAAGESTVFAVASAVDLWAIADANGRRVAVTELT